MSNVHRMSMATGENRPVCVLSYEMNANERIIYSHKVEGGNKN